MPPSPDALRRWLVRATDSLGSEGVSIDAEDRATYGRDWTRYHAVNASAVVFPRTREQLARLVRAAREEGVALVPSGGRTGLSAGAVATRGEVIVSLERMRALGAVDRRALTVRAEAGVVTEAVHRHTESFGLTWPVDFASKGSSTVGGNIATNAGGVKVIRHGLTRAWVLGLEVVTGAGDELDLNGALEKNNTGIDLRQLFIGSEGILGFITAATLKLTRVPGHLDVMLFSVRSLAQVLELFERARSAPHTISAFEFFTEACHRRVKQHRGLNLPFRETTSHYVLLEVEGATREALEDWIGALLEAEVIVDATLADNLGRARGLWELRESISESLSATGLPYKNDIALPIATLEPFTRELEALYAREWPGFEVCLFGHIGDGNLHVNIMKPDHLDRDAFVAQAKKADPVVFELLRAHGGSISAEHGIGLLKRESLGYSRSPAEIAIMRQLKAVFDPSHILNPGKVLGD